MEFSCLNDVLSLYAEVFGGDLLRYVIGAGGVYLLINVLFANRLSAHKIRSSQLPKGQIRRELTSSVRTVAIFAATGSCIVWGARSGLFEIYQTIPEYGGVYLVFSALVLIVLHDAWFYWSHRVLHYPPIFRRFHRLHHRSHQPTPFTSYSFDIGEAVINAVYLPLALLLLPVHPLALFVFVTHMMLRNALGHSGVEVFPADKDGQPIFGWFTSVTHHDMHHAHAGYNLGLYFTCWDKWMGTEHPDYAECYARVAPKWSVGRVKVGMLVFLIAVSFLAVRADAFELRGRYATPGLGTVVEFLPCTDAEHTTCAKLSWVWDRLETPYANVGDLLSSALVWSGDQWQGRMLNPENGWTFKGTIRSASPDRLEVKGCAGPICVNQVWHSTAALGRILVAAR